MGGSKRGVIAVKIGTATEISRLSGKVLKNCSALEAGCIGMSASLHDSMRGVLRSSPYNCINECLQG